jgi:tripeptidyl-peptidase-1
VHQPIFKDFCATMVRSLALTLSVGLAASTRLQTVERQQLHLRDDWVVLEKASAEEKHTVSIAVKQKNLDLLHDKLMEVSSPNSPKRGQYLTWEEAHQLTANPDATAAILSWLKENGVEVRSVHKHGHYIKAKTDVSTWERLLSTSFSRMAHSDKETSSVVRATADVSLPEDIAEHVEGIFMTTQLPPPMNPPPVLTPLDPAENTAHVDPATLKSYYKVTGEGSASVSQSVVETINQVASPSDLAAFQSEYSLPSQEIAKDIGGHNSDLICKFNPNSCAEANLDVQYMMAMAPGTPLTYWYDSNYETPFEDWIEQVAATENPPLVHSISYGGPEPLMAASVLNTFNTEAMKLGTQGISIFVSSGDDGVAGNGARGNISACGYTPSFPATSPYITAVGATQGGPVGGEEVACSGNTGGTITTGGGFSTNYAQPDWQASAVATFLSRDSSAVSGYASGRAYPDVAMAGFNYPVFIGGSSYLVSGTSASAPVVAGMVTLVNSRLAEQGKPPVGFINPTLYADNGAAFNDIVSGDNKCTAAGQGGATCCSQGFNAVEGWDAATGWGSVSFDKFSELFGVSSAALV